MVKNMRLILALCFCSTLPLPMRLEAQWENRKTTNVPRNADGSANLKAPAPRMADGKVDLSGIWEPEGIKFLINIAADLKPADIPFRPDYEQMFRQRKADLGKADPDARCLPTGYPRKDAITSPYKIIQLPDLIVQLQESRTTFRQIFLDGRKLPSSKDVQPTWEGYAVGHWEGNDRLVVESSGYNGQAWLDSDGHPMTDALKLTERFTRPNYGTLNIEITIDDPKAYTKPWTVHEHPHLLVDGTDLIESVCNENEKDLVHLVGK
jgi:hypothetical protein